MDGVTVGRIVHFHAGGERQRWNPDLQANQSVPKDCRAAVIVQVWMPASKGYVNLSVLTDWTNDHPGGTPGDRGLRWETSVDYAYEVQMEANRRTWHWPTECPNPVP